MMNSKKIDLSNFDFSEFQKEAIDKLKAGQTLTGKDGVLTPLIKEILEAALEGEVREEGKVSSKAFYSILGVNKDGRNSQFIEVYCQQRPEGFYAGYKASL